MGASLIDTQSDQTSFEIYQRITAKKKLVILFMLPFLIAAVLVSLFSGSMDITWSELFSALLKKVFPSSFHAEKLHYITVWELRLPVIAMGLLVGTALGMAGTGVQAIFNNPLASPYTLGISSAAGFGAALAILMGAGSVSGGFNFIIAGSAFLFSCIAFIFIYLIARLRGASSSTMLFAGIALMYLFSALLALIQYFAPEEVLQQIVFWMFGSLSGATWDKVFIVLSLVFTAGGMLVRDAWKLTALKFGDDISRGMGVDTQKLRFSTMICTSLLTAAAVCFTGIIGFIGLVAPHLARMLIGEDQRFLLPGSCLIGAVLLVTSDTIGKIIIAPYILPVGIVTSFIGAPFFIYLIITKRSNYW